MLRRLSIGLLASAVAIAPLPLKAQDGSAEDLGDVMSISLKDVVKPTLGFQGALQGAGTPNQAGIGGFLPLSVGDNSVWFLDVLANANFADYENNSSIINTDVAGTTISTSTRLGYRWLNGDRTWMFGINGGYDSRPMNTGGTDTGIIVSGTEKSAFFQQVAVNAEAVSNDWNFDAYAFLPVGDTEQPLNWFYQGGALNTYGLDVGYFITPELNASVGYYYQHGDLGSADGSGVLGRLAYEISNGLVAGVNLSYDEAFEARVSADIEVRFGGPSKTATRKKVQQQPVISALSSSPDYRNVRVHDKIQTKFDACLVIPSDPKRPTFILFIGQTCDKRIEHKKKHNAHWSKDDQITDSYTTIRRTLKVINDFCSTTRTGDDRGKGGYSRECMIEGKPSAKQVMGPLSIYYFDDAGETIKNNALREKALEELRKSIDAQKVIM